MALAGLPQIVGVTKKSARTRGHGWRISQAGLLGPSQQEQGQEDNHNYNDNSIRILVAAARYDPLILSSCKWGINYGWPPDNGNSPTRAAGVPNTDGEYSLLYAARRNVFDLHAGLDQEYI